MDLIALTPDRIAEVTHARLHGDARSANDTRVTGPVVIDSRQAEPGALFVALGGERVDGHDFAADAVRSGAVAVLGSRPMDLPEGAAQLLVDGGDDGVVAALGRLARAVATALPEVDVVAVTGSSGKTTTKDLLAQVLAQAGPTIAPVGSFNNEIGYPLTVLRADHDDRFVVLEAAARGIGHIAHLCAIAPPRVGAVLNVGSAHLGEFGSRAAIATAKGELVEALPTAEDGGVAVLNADDPAVLGMADRTRARVVTFGRSATADVRAEDVTLDTHGRPVFRLHADGHQAPVRLRLVGEHQVSNALAVAAVATRLGMTVTDAAAALSAADPVSRWRMEVTDGPEGVTVVNDAYNANPESMAAALETLRAIASGRRTVAVLGHMAELGDGHDTEHRELGRRVARAGVALLVTVGPQADAIAEGARDGGAWPGETWRVPDATAAVAALRALLLPKDVVIVKGSRVAGLERVAEQLTTEEAEL